MAKILYHVHFKNIRNAEPSSCNNCLREIKFCMRIYPPFLHAFFVWIFLSSLLKKHKGEAVKRWGLMQFLSNFCYAYCTTSLETGSCLFILVKWYHGSCFFFCWKGKCNKFNCRIILRVSFTHQRNPCKLYV